MATRNNSIKRRRDRAGRRRRPARGWAATRWEGAGKPMWVVWEMEAWVTVKQTTCRTSDDEEWISK